MPADLFHVTPRRNVLSVVSNGLHPGAKTRAQRAVEDPEKNPHDRQKTAEKFAEARRKFDAVLSEVRSNTPRAKQYPPRGSAVYFWPSKDAALDSASSEEAVVHVDMSETPPECQFAAGDHTILHSVHHAVWGSVDAGRGVPETAYEDARDFWNSVRWYEGGRAHGEEIWADCFVPPQAIVRVTDADTGEVLHRA